MHCRCLGPVSLLSGNASLGSCASMCCARQILRPFFLIARTSPGMVLDMGRIFRLRLLALFVAFAVSACGLPGAQETSASTSTDEYDLRAALDDRNGILGDSEAVRIQNQIGPELSACMDEAGFRYWPEDKSEQLDFATRMTNFMFSSDAYPNTAREAGLAGFGVGSGLLAAYADADDLVCPRVGGSRC